MGLKPEATLAHFEEVFSRSADPWQTRVSHAEKYKRDTVLSMLGNGRHGRILELGCGNGSNSVGLARKALALDACDGAVMALKRAASLIGDAANVHLHHTPLPARFPHDRYDAIVIAELLYYLNDACLASVMLEINRTLRPGGLLVLCHHHIQFADAIQRQSDLHTRFIGKACHGLIPTGFRRTSCWTAQSLLRPKI